MCWKKENRVGRSEDSFAALVSTLFFTAFHATNFGGCGFNISAMRFGSRSATHSSSGNLEANSGSVFEHKDEAHKVNVSGTFARRKGPAGPLLWYRVRLSGTGAEKVEQDGVVAIPRKSSRVIEQGLVLGASGISRLN